MINMIEMLTNMESEMPPLERAFEYAKLEDENKMN
jgi:hypothetical protein